MNSAIEVQRINVAAESAPVARAMGYVQNFAITTPEDAELLGSDLRAFKASREAIEAKRVQYTGPLNTLVKEINADFRPIIEGYDNAISAGKRKLLAFSEAQRIVAENAAREARERAAKEAAEAAAIAAKAEAEAREAERAAAAPGASQSEIEAASIQASASREIAAASMMAAQIAVAAPTPAASKVKGAGENWDGEVYDLKAFVLAIANSPQIDQLINLLDVNQIALRAKCKAEKSAFNMPGARAVNKGRIALR